MKTSAFTPIDQIAYQNRLAHTYRMSDNDLVENPDYLFLCKKLSEITLSYPSARVLEVGCGTGRYFQAIKNTDELVGIDPSSAMLAEAVHPILAQNITSKKITLHESRLLDYSTPHLFGIIYSFGVMGEHIPFGDVELAKIYSLLEPGGYFYVTTVNPFGFISTFLKQITKKLLRVLHLGSNLRFMNTTAYGFNTSWGMRKKLSRNGFEVITLETTKSDYPHYLVLARKKHNNIL